MSSHLSEFAKHLIANRGPADVGTIAAAFRNAGNDVVEHEDVQAELEKVDGLAFDPETKLWGLKKEQ
jgi:hypothetical protein